MYEDDIIVLRVIEQTFQPTFKAESPAISDDSSSEYEYQYDSDSDREHRKTRMPCNNIHDLSKQKSMPSELDTSKFIFRGGDDALKEFPLHLIHDLKAYYDGKGLQGTRPKCLTKRQTSSITHTSSGRSAYFAIKKTGQRLLQARFQWGDEFVTVVKERETGILNGGKAVMVVYGGGGFAGTNIKYSIRRPDGVSSAEEPQIVRMAQDTDEESAKSTGSSTLATVDAEQFGRPSPKTSAILRSNSIHAPITKRPAAKALPEEGESDDDAVISPGRRHTKIAKLQPPTAPSSTFSRQMQRLRKRAQKTSGYLDATQSTISKPQIVGRRSIQDQASDATPRADMPAPTMVNTVSVPLDHSIPTVKNTGHSFAFRDSKAESILYTKNVEECNTIQKLFAQARRAKIIDAAWPTLKLLFTADCSEREIIRADKDDEQYIKDLISQLQESSDIITQIVVVRGEE